MPKYLVYDRETGAVVHLHEFVEAVSGDSLTCSRDDVLALVDHPNKESLEVVAAEFESQTSERVLRVDPGTREVVTGTAE